MAKQTNRSLVFVLIVGLNVLLMSEIVRKYLVHNWLVLPIGEFFLFILGLCLLLLKAHSSDLKVLYWCLMVGTLQIASIMWGHNNVALGLVGLRSTLVAPFSLIISARLYRLIGKDKWLKFLYNMCSAWLVAMGVVAFLQLSLGPKHPINIIPEELGADERYGIGDWAYAGYSHENLFRPTSIFLHTGKFGQLAFLLASYTLFHRFMFKQRSVWSVIRTLLEFGVVIMTGQRAAILGYFILLIVLMWVSGGLKLRLLSVVTLVAFIIAGSLFNLEAFEVRTLSDLILIRIISGVKDADDRLLSNLIIPAFEVIDKFGILGAGTGAYSLGSHRWGGRPLWEDVSVGGPENSWLKVWAETGLFGTVLIGIGIVWVIVSGINYANARKVETRGGGLDWAVGYFCSYIFLWLALWSNTHDILGSVTTMSTALSFCGVLLNKERVIKHERSLFAGNVRRYRLSAK